MSIFRNCGLSARQKGEVRKDACCPLVFSKTFWPGMPWGEMLFLTLTNAHAEDAVEAVVELLGGAEALEATAQALTGEINAHNTFDAPEGVAPTPLEVAAEGKGLMVRLPAASVVAVEVRI